jgi:hypothetical protein
MEALLENLGLVADGTGLPGFVFGIVHVSLVIIGFYSGWSINRLLKITSKGYISGIIGASLAHIIADLVASILDPSMRARMLGIVIGGLIPFLFIPILDKYITKSENHIMIGDHEDIKKDLEGEHHR